MSKKNYASVVLGLALVLGVAAPASAQTVADLQAQIAALMAQIAALQGGSTTATAGTTFTQNLTLGSTGSEVVALQQMLVAKGFLTMPAGTAYGYFGGLTKAAVVKWQLANGVSPASGYFGPISRTKANGMPGTTTGGSTTGGSTTGGTISTPGVEGTITVSLNPNPASAKLYEGDTKRAVLGIKLEAKTSDIKIERIKLDLDHVTGTSVSDTNFYRKIADKVYIMDGSTVLASADLNADTVVKDGTDYFITLSGMSYVVPKDTIKVLTVALDANSNWDTDFDSETWSVGVPASGVRGVDGAGVNQYGPSTAFSRTFTTEGELSESATLTAATNVNTPVTAEVIANQGTGENELDNLELLKVDFKAEKDAVTITDLVVDITRGGVTTTATATTAYLYDGSTLVGSATVDATSATAMGATFTDIDYVVAKDTTKTLTVKVDIDSAGTGATTFLADIDTADITAENAAGTAITESGSATGNTITVRSVGPEFSLVSKSLTKSATASQNNYSTSTGNATFNIKIKAVGGDIYFGTQSASSTFTFQTYFGGTATTLLVASTTSWSAPSSGVVTTGLNSTTAFKLQEGNEITLPVEFVFEGRTTAGVLVSTGSYAVGLQSIKWSTDDTTMNTTSFMAGKTDWRTNTIALP